MVRLFLVLATGVLLTFSAGAAERPAEDFTRVDPKALGIQPFAEQKEPKSNFVVGGKNSTALIPKLNELAGHTVAELERDMRPGRLSRAGFLGKDERLLDVLAMDNRLVVDELDLTHQQLARHLHVLGALARKHAEKEPKEILYHGRRYRLKAVVFRATVESPFDDGTKTNCEATVTNLGNGKSISYALLVPHMIERYGFYEGRGTTYRVEPRAIMEVLDFLKAAKQP